MATKNLKSIKFPGLIDTYEIIDEEARATIAALGLSVVNGAINITYEV